VLNAGPVQILRITADLDNFDLVHAVADALRDAEVKAAASARPTAGMPELLQAVRDSGRRIAIVSNNSIDAVRAYLDRRELSGEFDHVIARDDGLDPRQLKPSAHLVNRALEAFDASRSTTTLFGDSASDIEAGLAAGVSTIGFANRPANRQTLGEAGAEVVVDTLAELTEALHSTGRPS
jgi:phosphoglycolate phosphatase